MPVDPDYMPDLDKEFRAWLDRCYPDWDSEFSGHIRDMEEAWDAAKQMVIEREGN